MVKKGGFNKEVDKIISDQIDGIDIREGSYKPDVNKFSDWLEFSRLYPDKDYMQFKKYCQKKKKVID